MVLRFLVQTPTVLCSAQASEGGARMRSQAPGLSASQPYCFGSVSDTPECASEHGVPVSTEGQDSNLDFSQGNKSIFLLSRLSAEHQISKCSIYIRFQIYILI